MTIRGLVDGNKNLTCLNVVLAGCFVVYHVFLYQYYCLSADDFASQGIPGFSYAWYFYWNWEGPFLSHFMQGLLFRLVVLGMPLFVGLLILKVSMVGSTATLLWAVSKRFQFDWNATQILCAALIFNITLYIKPTNYTGILYFSDFSEDPDHWINKDFRKAYNLDFKVALQPESHD